MYNQIHKTHLGSAREDHRVSDNEIANSRRIENKTYEIFVT